MLIFQVKLSILPNIEHRVPRERHFFTDADILRQKKGVAYPPVADSDARKAYPPQADSRRHGRRLFIE